MTRPALLLLAGLAAGPAFGQTKEVVKEINDKLDSLRSQDDQLKSILAVHPSVLAAKAKVQLAQAELQQAELAITQQLQALKADLQAAHAQRDAAVVKYERAVKLHKAGTINDVELAQSDAAVASTRVLARKIETEYQSLTTLPKSLSYKVDYVDAKPVASTPTGTGVLSDLKLASIMRTVVKTEIQGNAGKAIQEILAKGGYQGVLRAKPFSGGQYSDKIIKVNETAELPIATWIELIMDDVNSRMISMDTVDCYVRDYGLLIVEKANAPAGAVTLRDYVRQTAAGR
jgi:hypothetical protein